MLLGSINAKSFSRDFELFCSIAKAHESQDPDQNSNSVGWYALECTDVNSLTVIAEPIAKVRSLDHHRSPFVAFDEGNRGEKVLNVAMPPIVAFDLGERADVASAECCSWRGQEEQRCNTQQDVGRLVTHLVV